MTLRSSLVIPRLGVVPVEVLSIAAMSVLRLVLIGRSSHCRYRTLALGVAVAHWCKTS
ncbi:hypothetical protein D3C72_2441140 [compost metagenome]